MFSAYLKIGNWRSVFRTGLVLADLESVRREEGREAFQLLTLCLASRAKIKTGWRKEIRHGQKVVVGFVRIDTPRMDRAELPACPASLVSTARPAPEQVEFVPNVLQFIDDQVVLCCARAGQTLALGGFKQHCKFAITSQISLEIGSEQGSGRVASFRRSSNQSVGVEGSGRRMYRAARQSGLSILTHSSPRRI